MPCYFWNPVVFLVVLALSIASSLHVFCESSRDRRIGNRWWHVGINYLVCWPLSYLCWVFWWPGSLRQSMFGTDRDRARQWARDMIEKKKDSRAPNKQIDQ